MFIKDAIGVGLTAQDLPAEILRDAKSSIIELLSSPGGLSRIQSLDEDLVDIKALIRDLGVITGIAETKSDPIGTHRRVGLTDDHIQHSTRVHVANAMGDQAPHELRMLAAQGPMVSATNTLQSDVQVLRQRLEHYENEGKTKVVRESFKALAADKSKYPHLAKALAANPALLDEQLGKHGGSAEEFANAQEALAALYAPPPVREGNTDDQMPNSQQGKQAQGSGLDPTPPPIAQGKAGVFTPEDHAKLRDEIVRKNS